ncbi:MAG: heavy-metal-associated domain-containing protein [Bradymonadaceae bacterium]
MRTILGVVAAALLPLGLIACKSDTTSNADKTQAEAKTAASEQQQKPDDPEQGAAKKETDESAKSPGESSTDLATVKLSVKEMVCQGCSRAVKSNLKEISGVSKVETSFKEDWAKVSYDPDKAKSQQFVDALSDVEMNGKKMGWKVNVISQSGGKAEK